MRIIDPYFEIQDELDQASLVTRLEACGRICYKSEGKIDEGSAMPFVKKLAAHGHNSVLEMAVVTFTVRCEQDHITELFNCQPKYLVIDRYEEGLLVTGSIRSFRELYTRCGDVAVVNAMVSSLGDRHGYLFEGVWNQKDALPVAAGISVQKIPLEEVEKLPAELMIRHRYVGVKMVINRAVTHELVRHRPCSFLQESQRYCRYSKDQFGNEVTFIKPMFYEEGSEEYALWVKAMEDTEKIYLQLLETSTAQAARTVLPNSCKTEIIVYCNLVEWQHIFMLRTSKGAEPSMREIMIPLAAEFDRRYPSAA